MISLITLHAHALYRVPVFTQSVKIRADNVMDKHWPSFILYTQVCITNVRVSYIDNTGPLIFKQKIITSCVLIVIICHNCCTFLIICNNLPDKKSVNVSTSQLSVSLLLLSLDISIICVIDLCMFCLLILVNVCIVHMSIYFTIPSILVTCDWV